jgi:hypothetical protein
MVTAFNIIVENNEDDFVDFYKKTSQMQNLINTTRKTISCFSNIMIFFVHCIFLLRLMLESTIANKDMSSKSRKPRMNKYNGCYRLIRVIKQHDKRTSGTPGFTLVVFGFVLYRFVVFVFICVNLHYVLS